MPTPLLEYEIPIEGEAKPQRANEHAPIPRSVATLGELQWVTHLWSSREQAFGEALNADKLESPLESVKRV
jgi:hypothetical protein